MIDEDIGRIAAVFSEQTAYHIVFVGEVVPFSVEVDDVYREFRREHYGWPADIESFALLGSAKPRLRDEPPWERPTAVQRSHLQEHLERDAVFSTST